MRLLFRFVRLASLVLGLGIVSVSCTRPNPAVCCIDQADCQSLGISEIRACADGLACVDHACVAPTCSTEGCGAAAPVCNTTIDACEGCTDSSECERFPQAAKCDVATGGCVECVAPADCPAERPICDSNACRGCRLDAECPSGACGDDGGCLEEGEVVYLDPSGNDAGTCSRTAPCRTLAFAVSVTTNTRNHIVLAQGAYAWGYTTVSPDSTTASYLFIHGHGAGVAAPVGGDGSVLAFTLGATLRDLAVDGKSSDEALNLSAATFVLERVTTRAGTGIALFTSATVRELVHETPNSRAIVLLTGAQLTLEGGVIRGGYRGIDAENFGTNVQISNLLAYGTTDLALNLEKASGEITSSTIADAGADSGTGPRAVSCSALVTIRSSIIWTPGASSRVPMQGCNSISTIAGPVAVSGASNSNPSFVNAAMRDYHLAPNSPARDAVDTGPPKDFEGDLRPQGSRFDIGADEAAP